MTITRRAMLAATAATLVRPAWAQAIAPQGDPWAQVDPYADARNGFPTDARPTRHGAAPGRDVFRSGALRSVSAEDEAREIQGAAQAYGPNLAEEGGAVANPRLQRAIADFIAPLTRVADRAHLPWQATVAANPTVNAWAMGGGKLCFNAGLIAMCDHPGELAAVVAHEIGHVDLAHQLMRGQLGATLAQADAAGMLDLGKVSAGALVPGAEGASMLGLLRAGFSRDNEFEADEHAVELMRRAGIDPAWAVGMMRKLVRYGYENGHHLVNPLVPDHPPAAERAERLSQLVAAAPPTAGFAAPGWDVLKSVYPTPPKWRSA